MGLGDAFKSLVLTEYKADTKQMRRELKKLEGDEKKAHQARIDRIEEEAEKRKKDREDRIAGLKDLAIKVGITAASYAALTESADFYAERSRLMAKTVGVDMAALKKATNGLVSEQRLLEFAAKATTGTFKLNQQQMEDSLRGVIAMRNEGHELSRVFDGMEKAVVEGSVEPLKEFGHVIKDVENDTREGLNAALKDLRETARNAGPDLGMPGDEMARSTNEMKDAVDDLKTSLGKLAISLAPLIAKLAKMVGYIADLAGHAADINRGDQMRRFVADPEGEMDRARLGQRLNFADEIERPTQGRGFGAPMHGPFLSEMTDNSIRNKSKKKGKGGSGRFEISGGLGRGSVHSMSEELERIRLERLAGSEAAHLQLADEREELLAKLEELRAIGDGSAAAANAVNVAGEFDSSKRRKTILEGMIGTPEEINAISVALEGFNSTFGTVTDAFGQGIDALITGSESFGKAFKKALGENLRNLSVELGIQGLKHAAYAIGSAAFMDWRGAKQHALAAGAFGLGSLAAGAAASKLGAGGSDGPRRPATAGSAGVGASGGGQGEGRGSSQIFIVGNDFAGLPARQREAQWRQISRSAGITIEGDAIVDG